MIARFSRPAPYVVASALVLVTELARADVAEPRTPTPFDGFGHNAAASFTGTSLLFHAGAIGSTGVLAWSGADHGIRVYVQRHLTAPFYGSAAYYAGYGVPLLGAPVFYFVSLLTSDTETIGAAAAVLQSLAFTVSTTVLLKIGTGRPFPLHGGDPDAPDRLEHPEYAREFSPFAFDGRFAWPSGHTSSMTCIAASLSAYFDDSWVVPAVGYPVALATGFGMIVADRHWASDVVAGALMGHAIGWSVGAGFRESVRASGQRKEGAARLRIIPLSGSVTGLAAIGDW